MKKLLFLFFVTFLSVSISSCDKGDVVISGNYLDYSKGDLLVSATDGDLVLKAAPSIGGREVRCYKSNKGSWILVAGDNFLPNSEAANYWSANVNLKWYNKSELILLKYCPITQLRVVTLSTVGAKGTAYSYLGISDFTPTPTSPSISVKGRRLGDKLIIDAEDLKYFQCYGVSVYASYNKSVIDVEKTILNSFDTKNAWPNYVYSSVVRVVDQKISLNGDQLIYDALDSKITGDITLRILIGCNEIIRTVDALQPGKGLKIAISACNCSYEKSSDVGITASQVNIMN